MGVKEDASRQGGNGRRLTTTLWTHLRTSSLLEHFVLNSSLPEFEHFTSTQEQHRHVISSGCCGSLTTVTFRDLTRSGVTTTKSSTEVTGAHKHARKTEGLAPAPPIHGQRQNGSDHIAHSKHKCNININILSGRCPAPANLKFPRTRDVSTLESPLRTAKLDCSYISSKCSMIQDRLHWA